MPKRKFSNGSTRARKRAKPTAKIRSIRSKTTNVVLSRGPIAPRTIVKLKYHEDWVSPGTVYDHVWNLNSIFDPNRTGTGHQPYGHDQYLTFYNRYRVFAVSYNLSISALGADENYKVSVGPSNDASTYTNPSLAAETPGFYTRVVSNAQPIIMKGKYSLPNITGVTKTQYKTDDRFQSQFGASPTELIVMHVVASSIGSDAAPAANKLGYSLNLVYHCELFDPNTLGQS